jgi:hypothetical protein
MTSYTITVAPSDGSGATTTITVDASDGDVRITDVHLRAAAGLTATQLPSIDISLLMQAVSPQLSSGNTAPVAPAVTDQPEPTVPALREAATGTDDTARAADADAPASAGADEPAVTPSRSATRRRQRETADSSNGMSANATSPRPRRRGGSEEPAAATPARKGRTARKQTPPAVQERVYRRMPADFAFVAPELNSASAIAAHYQVPRHTVQGWLRRLRAAATD